MNEKENFIEQKIHNLIECKQRWLRNLILESLEFKLKMQILIIFDKCKNIQENSLVCLKYTAKYGGQIFHIQSLNDPDPQVTGC